MPTSPALTWTNQRLRPAISADTLREIAINLKPAAANTVVNYAKGTVMGELTATPGTYAAYASGNNDGTQNPKGLLSYDCAVDQNGNITLTSTTGQTGGEFGQQVSNVPMCVRGFFFCADLTGMTLAALTAMGGRLIEGIITAGMLELP